MNGKGDDASRGRKGRGGIEKIAKKVDTETQGRRHKISHGGGGRIHGHPNPPTPKI